MAVKPGIGKMDRIVVFQVNAPDEQGAGNADNYRDLLTTRGYLKRNTGSRNNAFGDIQGDESAYLIVRKQEDLVDALAMSMKVIIDQVEYTVQGWQDVEDNHFYYRFELTKQINNNAVS